jgi:Flp pilus assembly CpaE family ATPase
MLKIESPVSIRDAASRISDMDEVLWPQMVTKVREGLDVLHSGPASLSNTIDSETLLRLIDFWCRAYDVVCVDLSGSLEQYSLDVLRVANRIFVVSTSELASLHLLKEKVQLLKANGMGDRVRVIHNRATRHEDLSKRQIEELAGLPVSKVFPNSYAEAAAATKEGRTIRANSILGSEFSAFASEMLSGQARSKTPKTFTERLLALAGKGTFKPSAKAVTVASPAERRFLVPETREFTPSSRG